MMKSHSSENRPAESPLWQLLSAADDVSVLEVGLARGTNAVASVEDAIKNFSADESYEQRAFLVTVRTPRSSQVELPKEPARERAHLIENAALLLKHSDHLLARHIYSYLVKRDPQDAEALKGLGICQLKLGQLAAAKKCFQSLLELKNNEEALFWLGRCHVADGEDGIAIGRFEEISWPESLSAEDRFMLFKELGNCHARRGSWEAAAACYEKAMQLDPDSDVIHVNFGTLEIQRSRYAEAVAHFKRAIELNPSSTRAYCGLGIVFLMTEDYASATAAFNAALDTDPRNLVALHHILVIAHHTGDLGASKSRLTAYLEKDTRNADIRYALAAVLLKEGDKQGARRELKLALEIVPAHVKARKLLEEIPD